MEELPYSCAFPVKYRKFGLGLFSVNCRLQKPGNRKCFRFSGKLPKVQFRHFSGNWPEPKPNFWKSEVLPISWFLKLPKSQQLTEKKFQTELSVLYGRAHEWGKCWLASPLSTFLETLDHHYCDENF